MPSLRSTRQSMLWLGVTVVLVTAVGVVGREVLRAKTNRALVAAYLIPIDNHTRVKPTWWYSVDLALPRALRSGEQLTLPAGASVMLVHADSGVAEPVTGPTTLSLLQKPPSEPDALVSPLSEIVSVVNTKERNDRTVIITSPVGITRYLNPLITWTAREGMTYDVAVTDSADEVVPPRVARGVRPPIALADLQTPQRRQLGIDRNYTIIIREANAPTIAAGAFFLTTTDAKLENPVPTTPADLIAEAAAAMAKMPTRTGDAWLALSRLPTAWAGSELGVRLRIRVAAGLGLTDDLNRALAEARALKSP